jgi:hypothetical protein
MADVSVNPDRALRALLAPGAVTVVALAGVEVVGFAHAVTDSVTTYLAELLVTLATAVVASNVL